MKRKLSALFLCLFLVPLAQAKKNQVLPDACGDPKAEFDVKTLKDQLLPEAPEAGKAQIIFVENFSKNSVCMGGCGNNLTRFGMDGAWVGATKGNSYFALSVDPGVHHLCAVVGKEADAQSLTVEAGKVYYYQANYQAEFSRYGGGGPGGGGGGRNVKKTVDFSLLSEDEGKFRVKSSELATWKSKTK